MIMACSRKGNLRGSVCKGAWYGFASATVNGGAHCRCWECLVTVALCADVCQGQGIESWALGLESSRTLLGLVFARGSPHFRMRSFRARRAGCRLGCIADLMFFCLCCSERRELSVSHKL